MAEGVFRHLKASRDDADWSLDWTVDSCGTAAYHVGESPDPRTMSVLQDHDIVDYRHAARQLGVLDFYHFDYILAMDKANLRNVNAVRARAVQHQHKLAAAVAEPKLAQTFLFGDFGGRGAEEVADPYYGGHDGFEKAYQQLVRFSHGFLDHVRQTAGSTDASQS